MGRALEGGQKNDVIDFDTKLLNNIIINIDHIFISDNKFYHFEQFTSILDTIRTLYAEFCCLFSSKNLLFKLL